MKKELAIYFFMLTLAMIGMIGSFSIIELCTNRP
jgi:hypothetical protein